MFRYYLMAILSLFLLSQDTLAAMAEGLPPLRRGRKLRPASPKRASEYKAAEAAPEDIRLPSVGRGSRGGARAERAEESKDESWGGELPPVRGVSRGVRRDEAAAAEDVRLPSVGRGPRGGARAERAEESKDESWSGELPPVRGVSRGARRNEPPVGEEGDVRLPSVGRGSRGGARVEESKDESWGGELPPVRGVSRGGARRNEPPVGEEGDVRLPSVGRGSRGGARAERVEESKDDESQGRLPASIRKLRAGRYKQVRVPDKAPDQAAFYFADEDDA